MDTSNMPCLGEISRSSVSTSGRTTSRWHFSCCLRFTRIKNAAIFRKADQRGRKRTYCCCGTFQLGALPRVKSSRAANVACRQKEEASAYAKASTAYADR